MHRHDIASMTNNPKKEKDITLALFTQRKSYRTALQVDSCLRENQLLDDRVEAAKQERQIVEYVQMDICSQV